MQLDLSYKARLQIHFRNRDPYSSFHCLKLRRIRMKAFVYFVWGFSACNLTSTEEDVVDYTNYAVVKATPVDSYALTALQTIEEKYTVQLKLDFWNHPSNFTDTVSISLPKENVADLLVLFSSVGVSYVISTPNLQELIDKQKEEIGVGNFAPESKSADFALDNYHPLDEIMNYVKLLAEEYPDLVEMQVIGESVENREIIGLKIGLNSNEKKPIFYIDAGIHGREWIAPTVALYIINDLLTNEDDPTIQELLTEYNFFIIPVLNPDGYEWTWTKKRMWRKNRSKNNGSPNPGGQDCRGVDLNRNFELGFKALTSTNASCTIGYPGPVPFSEPETRAVKKYTEENASLIKIAITLHSYGQVWISPWGYIKDDPKDYEAMMAAAKVATEAFKAVHNSYVLYGSISKLIYTVKGNSVDWQYNVTNSPYCYGIELRDRGEHGLFLPTEQIIPTGEENWAGLKALAKFILD